MSPFMTTTINEAHKGTTTNTDNDAHEIARMEVIGKVRLINLLSQKGQTGDV